MRIAITGLLSLSVIAMLALAAPVLAADADVTAASAQFTLPPPTTPFLKVVAADQARFDHLKRQGYRCFKSIQHAVDTCDNGYTVFVTAGEYREDVLVINIKDLEIIGEDGAVVIADRDEHVIDIEYCTGVHVANLQVVHETGESPCLNNCFVILDCLHVLIEHCDISGCGYIGVEVLGNGQPGDIRVENCYIHDCEVAFYDVTGGALADAHNTLARNTEERW